MWKKSKENLQKRRFPAYFQHFRPEKMFSKIANTRFCAKNQEKQMMKSRENAKKLQKTGFFGIFPAFSVEKKKFFENRSPSYFRYCHFTSVCKIS